MIESDRVLTNVVAKLVDTASAHSERRVLCVRWINELFYAMRRTRAEIFSIARAEIERISLGIGSSGAALHYCDRAFDDACFKIEFLAERLLSDFEWLRESDQRLYFELSESLRRSSTSPKTFAGLAEVVIREICGPIFRLTHHQENCAPDVAAGLWEILDAHTRAMMESEAVVRSIVLNLGVQLLTIEEFELAATAERVGRTMIFSGEVTVTNDTYNIGQAIAAGPGAAARTGDVLQVAVSDDVSIDFERLAEELSRLRSAMKSEATTPDHDIAVSEVAKAEKAANAKDGKGVMGAIKAAGKWSLAMADKLGTTALQELIKQAMK